ncbi:hypothetical protein FH972_025916 [Carpinus fangiana]|uniref:Metal-dependent protein hydrolase n=1 Tax=Carpinus fangiana TaxID=176857 RepID=A0A5N6L2S6_9ROSI|nr:hypothetical protein FH972_025916 [Carpinus fangiana]
MLRSIKHMAETAAKKQKMSGPLIGTHSGHFHADEALAVHMLRLLPTYSGSPLVRTRDPEILKTCHTVVDVGGQYDASANRFDHHQREFATTFPGRKTKLSSAGLVFMHMGKAIIAQQTGYKEDSNEVKQLYEKMYDDFVEAFDANDNGISAYDTQKLRDVGVEKKFNDRGFSIASVVGRFNHDRKAAADGEDKTGEQKQAEEDARFLKASEFTGTQFDGELADAAHSWLPARHIVHQAFRERKQYDREGRILVLPHRKEGLPWHDHLFQIEAEESTAGNVLYALFSENGEPDSKWRIRAVSQSQEGFELRKPLPEAWRGVRDQELSSLAGIEGCIFVHASGFIGGNASFDGALKMAQKALEI